MAKITLKWIEKEVIRMDPTIVVGSESFKTAVILMTSCKVGPNVKEIAKFTHYTRDEVTKRANNLRKNKLWVGSKLRYDWWNEDGSGWVAFWLDNLIADGLITTKTKK
jgi:hypothetical protein